MITKNTRILITGVAGLIGSHLLDRLLEQYPVHIIGVDNLSTGKYKHISHHSNDYRFTFHKIDILNSRRLASIARGVDYIIHQAAHKKISENDNALPLLKTNVYGTENILEIARKNKAKVIAASTSDVYGRLTKLPFSENDELILGGGNIKRWAYATSKLFEEQLLFAYYKDHGVPIVVLRYFGTFGPRASFTGSGGHIPIFIDKICRKQPILIHGNGKQTRCMSYITDVVEPTIHALTFTKAVGEIINIGNQEEISVIDCAKRIHRIVEEITCKTYPLKITKVSVKKTFGAYKEISRRIPDLAKCKRILNYEPQISFDNGLRTYIRWYLKKS